MADLCHSVCYAIYFTKTKITLDPSRCHCVYVCIIDVTGCFETLDLV